MIFYCCCLFLCLFLIFSCCLLLFVVVFCHVSFIVSFVKLEFVRLTFVFLFQLYVQLMSSPRITGWWAHKVFTVSLFCLEWIFVSTKRLSLCTLWAHSVLSSTCLRFVKTYTQQLASVFHIPQTQPFVKKRARGIYTAVETSTDREMLSVWHPW